MAKLTGGAVVVLLFEVFATLAHISRAVGTPRGKGVDRPPDIGRSGNPISIKGIRLCLPHYYSSFPP